MFLIINVLQSCKAQNSVYTMQVFETSQSGSLLHKVERKVSNEEKIEITLNPKITYQKIIGFGGSFTEASATVLNQLSKANKDKILNAYFSEAGANYSLTRTHIASCDFSLNNYTYAKVEDDFELKNFTIEEDKNDLIPMILQAKSISKDGFNLIASPWSCPPWMKDNKSYVGGKLLPKYNDVFALYFEKYLDAYQREGIPIWGLTVINEPHGNGNNWESTLFSPSEMTNFVENHLGPKLKNSKYKEVKILGYDQNRAGLQEWVDEMYKTKNTSQFFDGTAIHWYESTYDYFPKQLQYAHFKAPNKYLIQTEACIDSEIPKWKDDSWYWKKEATDWGWDWASEKEKYLHPKYAPVHRYATDIIGCLNNWVDGWIDWNMVLNKQGGPNWFKNWCIAPVIADTENDEVYFTPLYYVMSHFSKFIRPNATKIDCKINSEQLLATAVENTDKSIVVVVFNPTNKSHKLSITIEDEIQELDIQDNALQTIILKKNN
jgi:glucosylceramidase